MSGKSLVSKIWRSVSLFFKLLLFKRLHLTTKLREFVTSVSDRDSQFELDVDRPDVPTEATFGIPEVGPEENAVNKPPMPTAGVKLVTSTLRS